MAMPWVRGQSNNMIHYKITNVRLYWSLPNDTEHTHTHSHALIPFCEDGEAAKLYWPRVITYLRQAFNIPANATIILT